MKDTIESIIVYGGHKQGNSPKQLSYPFEVFADHGGNVFVADSYNYRVMRWSKEDKEGSLVVGGNEKGKQPI